MLDGHVIQPGHGTRTPAIRIAVVETEGAWRLFLNGESVGRFGCREDALECALDVARETRLEGSEVEVLAQDRFGELSLAEGASFRPRPLSHGGRA